MSNINRVILPLKSGNHFTNIGWVYYNDEKKQFQQDEKIVFVDCFEVEDEENPCFTFQECDSENIIDAIKWFTNDYGMVAIIDETCGGIIGYVNPTHADRINTLLNII